jgi:hypothetical protein
MAAMTGMVMARVVMSGVIMAVRAARAPVVVVIVVMWLVVRAHSDRSGKDAQER